MAQEKIKFTDKDDLIKKLVFKKSDINHEGAVNSLKAALKRVKRGDKEAAKLVVKLRNRMLSASALAYIELEEDELFNVVSAEIEVIDSIDLEDKE